MGTIKHRYLGIGVVCSAMGFTACGGAAPEPQSAPIESEPAPPSEASLSGEDAEPADEADEPAPSTSPGEPASPADLQEALQIVVSDEALQRALNLTEPGRFPVKISGANIPSDLKLEVGGKPVEVIAQPEDPKTVAVLIISDFDLNSSSGSFRYRYDIEGVRGTSYVVKTGERWELQSSRLSEY